MKLMGLAVHAFIIWLACGLTVALGRGMLDLETTLWVHAAVAPTVAALVSLFYFRRASATTPFRAAVFFLLFVVILDAALVAPVFERSYAMFSSFLGTWLPFASIFLATYVTGTIASGRRQRAKGRRSSR